MCKENNYRPISGVQSWMIKYHSKRGQNEKTIRCQEVQ